jgi:redox-sensitive bicupin YhaK (pirin superfamily)
MSMPASADTAIETVIVPRARDLGGGFGVRRALPAGNRQMVGPFIFFDQMGPVMLRTGEGLDVRPHPHINLATVTYLFEGEITHRDSLGSEVVIRPGAINWMTAGRGIVHSERSPPEERVHGPRLSGLQLWVALPRAHEEVAPSFAHYDAQELPTLAAEGKELRVMVGQAWGVRSPVITLADTVYADLSLQPAAVLPLDAEHEERALYTLKGTIEIAGVRYPPGQLLVLQPGRSLSVCNAGDDTAHCVLIGGERMDAPRYIWWNFVSSRLDRIEQAKADWKAGRFDSVSGDAEEFIPLPES